MASIYLTDREYAVLKQLDVADKYGAELVAGSNGALKRCTIYVLLGQMKEKALIEGHMAPGGRGPMRCVYKITPLGKECRDAEADRDR